MIFEIEDIPERGLNLELLVAKEEFEINDSDCSLLDDIKVKGSLSRIERKVSFSGELQAILRVACTRCLNLFSYNVETGVKAYFKPREKDSSPGGVILIPIKCFPPNT